MSQAWHADCVVILHHGAFPSLHNVLSQHLHALISSSTRIAFSHALNLLRLQVGTVKISMPGMQKFKQNEKKNKKSSAKAAAAEGSSKGGKGG